jgi:hypothetical protein
MRETDEGEAGTRGERQGRGMRDAGEKAGTTGRARGRIRYEKMRDERIARDLER